MNIFDLKNESFDIIKKYIDEEKTFFYWNQEAFNIEVYVLDTIKYRRTDFSIVLRKDANRSLEINIGYVNFQHYHICDNVPELLSSLQFDILDTKNIENKALRLEVQTKLDILSQVYPEAFV
jgi:hypothetical protein